MVRQCFDLFGWVCVSEDFNIRRMIKATIESVTGNSSGLSELSPLQEELAKILKDKRILLVLDDVWNENRSLWHSFQVAFKKAKLVRVLVTTRNEKVAKVMQTTTFSRPDCLPEDSCWQLFQHYAFGGTSCTVPIQFTEMGIGIIRKCGGLPLAIKSIASLLRHETDEESWREVLENDLWESNPDIFRALQISYAHLPTHLKPCFLLCSMYPRDYEIKKINLIELWISHGYIKSTDKKTSREVGAEYYEELSGRSFIEVSFANEQCKLHDIIHDLARLNSEKEHYSVEVSRVDAIQEVNIPEESHHLYVRDSVGCVNEVFQQNLKGLRTLSVDSHGFSGYSNTIFYLKSFAPLRVLELEGSNLRDIPDSIAQLKHLSHIRITSVCLEYLPESIGFLYNLRTFILDCWLSKFKCLPESMGDLANLQHLCIKGVNFKRLPNSFFLLSNLQRLEIQNRNLDEVTSDSRMLCNLEELIIDCWEIVPPKVFEIRSFGAHQKLLVALASCPKLKTLKIGGCCVNYSPHRLKNFPAMRTMVACLRVTRLGWLKDMKDLEGELSIEGLENISNLVDAQHVNLRSKWRIESLNLHWYISNSPEHSVNSYKEELEPRITVIKTPDEGKGVIGDDMKFGLLEYLQPHPHLKKLLLRDYPSAALPGWLGDTSYLQAIHEIRLISCDGLQSLPFHNLHTLKSLQVSNCSSIKVLPLEQLPFQLEELKIVYCDNLELISGLHNMGMLNTLKIRHCEALKSITMDKLQLEELTLALYNSTCQKTCEGRHSTLSLKRFSIEDCPLLSALPSALKA